ncbi:hypothetical protein FRB95_005320 [Tulasnella sp. JGI-2019a]|nr:hypothetical protein FRB95_005320 [Tulasnella sp. JGI-2019a]
MTSGTHVPTNSEGLGSALAEADVHPSIVSQEITKSAVPEFQDNNRTTVPTVVTQGATGART